MSENVLLLQGPVGPFFARLARDLTAYGHNVFKINFNAGDRLFGDPQTNFDYTGTPRDWSEWLRQFVDTRNITRIYLFGDSRFYHRMAKKVAQKAGIQVFVFECGYIRPDCVTLEAGGVNGNSSIPRDPDFYRSFKATPARRDHALKGEFLKAASWAILYYLEAFFGRWRFPHYQHHRPLNPLSEGLKWLLSGVQKLRSTLRRPALERRLYQNNPDPYFFVPLQVHSDAQVRRHSHFRNIEAFITDVVESFAEHAPSNTRLVFKHHPMDRPYRHYGSLIHGLTKKLGLGERVIYLHDLHLPTLLHHAVGTVTINSTVGLSSIHHRTPVKTLGEAVYDIPGMTHQGSLASFWAAPDPVDHALYNHFRAYLLRNNQLRGSLYQPLVDAQQPSGLSWPVALEQVHLQGRPQQVPLRLLTSETGTLVSAA